MERFYHLGIPVYAELGVDIYAIEVNDAFFIKNNYNPRQDIPYVLFAFPIVVSAEV